MLFAPKLAQDSIIIHELAHLIELNHSEKYWKLVYKSMPDYDVYEKWLKTNNNNCDF